MDKKNFFLIGAGVAAVVLLALAAKKAGSAVVEAAGDAAQAVNPFNNDNIINQGFTSIYQAVTGSEGTLGGDIYDVTHDGTLNPASDNNIINRGVNSVGSSISGDKNWTLGGWIYDITH